MVSVEAEQQVNKLAKLSGDSEFATTDSGATDVG